MRLKSLFSAKDMTVGAPWQRIAEFAIPMLLGNIAQQLYNTVDSIIVGSMWATVRWLRLERQARS